MPLTLFSQLELALTARNTLLLIQSLEHLKHFKNAWLRPLFRPRTNHTYHQKPNQSPETVPLRIVIILITARQYSSET
jgi:hypothetical protein